MPSEIRIAILQAIETVEHFCMNKMKEQKTKHKLLTHQNFICQDFAEHKVLAVYSTCPLSSGSFEHSCFSSAW